ncbi:hypothetical protein Taro_018725 [Colocasia esculenta]|uniref:Uncharacterized protein n=1 Tax=Colocasia esculenta TaxID=4460 RepID=A0A843URI0_COLES|nr:hypothetical protein [Colocasia esculenta]
MLSGFRSAGSLGVPGGRACGETVLLTWLLGVSRGDTWLFLPDLVEVRDVGACVVRLWSYVVAPVFHELLCLGGCEPRCCFRIVFDSAGSTGVVFGPTLVVVVVLFEFIAYLTRLNSNPFGSSDPWVAARPSGVPGGGPGGRGPSVSYRRVLLLLLGARAASVVAVFARAAVGFVLGLCVRVGMLRRLREPTCGVAFTGAGLWSAEPVEGVLALLTVPLLLGCSRSSSLLVLVEVRFPQNCVVLISSCCGVALWVEEMKGV